MSALPKDDRITEAEYLALDHEGSDVKYEYINGYVYAMSGASKSHIRIEFNLPVILSETLDTRGCEGFGSDMQVKVEDSATYSYPDLSIVCEPPEFNENSSVATLLNPVVIIEILSPSTALKDRTIKFYEYQKIPSLQDYLLISQEQPRIERFSRGEGDTWSVIKVEGLENSISIPSLEFSLQLSAVYARVQFDGDEDSQNQS